MSKNLTRKGLALGALVALGTSLFAGAPAQAGIDSTGITLAPSAGTSYTSIAGASFDLSTVVNTGLGTPADKLSYLITNNAGSALKFSFAGANTPAPTTPAGFSIWSADTADNISGTAGAATYQMAASAKTIVVTGTGTNIGRDFSFASANRLTVTSSTDATESVTVGVQAFLDANSNGKIDQFDLVSPVRTITFLPAAQVSATAAITSAVIGTNKLQVSVTLGNDVNMANIGSGVNVKAFRNGLAISIDSVDTVDATYDATDKLLKNAKTWVNTITAGVYTAQAYFGLVKLGAASSAVAPQDGTGPVDSIDFIDVAPSANVNQTVSKAAANRAIVRTGYTGDVTFTSKATWHSTDGNEYTAPAGVTVRVTLTRATLASASTFTAGGKTLTATSGPQTFTVLTGTDGKVSFTGAGTGAKGDSVTVNMEALMKSGGFTALGRNITATYTDAAVTSIDSTDLSGASAVRKSTVGGSYTLNYLVRDQFGQASTAAGTYRVDVSSTGGTAGIATRIPVVAGKATQTIVDDSTVAGTYTLTAQLKKLSTVTNLWENLLSPATQTVVVNADTAESVSATASSTVPVATITKSLVTADLRVDGSQTPDSIGYGAATQTISGWVTGKSGARVAGATVTVSGAGLAFVVDGKVYSVGSATINADASGNYSVAVYSISAGKTTVTVASGAATKTVDIEFTGVTTLEKDNVLTVDAPSLLQAGRSVTLTIKLTNKLGTAVDTADGAITVGITGPGQLSATTVGTDANGLATVQLVLNTNDFGDSVITVKYTATDSAKTVVSATKTVTVGVTDAQVDIVKNRVTAVASFTKGKTVAFFLDGVRKWSKRSESDADVVISSNLKKGKHIVTVKISGGFVTTETVIVK